MLPKGSNIRNNVNQLIERRLMTKDLLKGASHLTGQTTKNECETIQMWKLELDCSSASTTNLMMYIEHEMAVQKRASGSACARLAAQLVATNRISKLLRFSSRRCGKCDCILTHRCTISSRSSSGPA